MPTTGHFSPPLSVCLWLVLMLVLSQGSDSQQDSAGLCSRGLQFQLAAWAFAWEDKCFWASQLGVGRVSGACGKREKDH